MSYSRSFCAMFVVSYSIVLVGGIRAQGAINYAVRMSACQNYIDNLKKKGSLSNDEVAENIVMQKDHIEKTTPKKEDGKKPVKEQTFQDGTEELTKDAVIAKHRDEIDRISTLEDFFQHPFAQITPTQYREVLAATNNLYSYLNPSESFDFGIVALDGSSRSQAKAPADFQTITINAVTEFIANRARDELVIVFMEKARDILTKPFFAKFFHHTVALLDDGVKHPERMVIATNWKNAIQKDINEWPDSLIRVVENDDNFKSIAAHVEISHLMESSLFVYRQFQSHMSPYDMIEYLSMQYHDDNIVDNGFQVARWLAHSFSSDKKSWLQISDLRSLDPPGLKMFCAVLYHNLEMLDPNLLTKLGFGNWDEAHKQSAMQDISNSVIAVSQKLNDLTKSKDSGTLPFINGTFDLVDTIAPMVARWTNLPVPKYLPVARTFVRTTNDLISKNYTAAFVEVNDGFQYLKEQSIYSSAPLDEFFRYGSFVAQVAEAKSSDDIETLLEAQALPRQSYRLKRRSTFSVTLNSYPGIAALGQEWIQTDPVSNVYNNNYEQFGIACPIGLEFNFGNINMGLMLSVFDIAGPLSARLKTTFDSTKIQSIPNKITWAQLFAPGAGLYFGLNDLPLAFGLHAGYYPQSRDVTTNSVTTTRDAVRIFLNIAVDVPIFSFYSNMQE